MTDTEDLGQELSDLPTTPESKREIISPDSPDLADILHGKTVSAYSPELVAESQSDENRLIPGPLRDELLLLISLVPYGISSIPTAPYKAKEQLVQVNKDFDVIKNDLISLNLKGSFCDYLGQIIKGYQSLLDRGLDPTTLDVSEGLSKIKEDLVQLNCSGLSNIVDPRDTQAAKDLILNEKKEKKEAQSIKEKEQNELQNRQEPFRKQLIEITNLVPDFVEWQYVTDSKGNRVAQKDKREKLQAIVNGQWKVLTDLRKQINNPPAIGYKAYFCTLLNKIIGVYNELIKNNITFDNLKDSDWESFKTGIEKISVLSKNLECTSDEIKDRILPAPKAGQDKLLFKLPGEVYGLVSNAFFEIINKLFQDGFMRREEYQNETSLMKNYINQKNNEKIKGALNFLLGFINGNVPKDKDTDSDETKDRKEYIRKKPAKDYSDKIKDTLRLLKLVELFEDPYPLDNKLPLG